MVATMPRKKATISVSSGSKRPNFTLISEESRKFEKLFESAMYYIHYEYENKKLKSETIRYAKKLKIDTKPLEKLEKTGKNTLIRNWRGLLALGTQ